jgi:HK97 gp10 family phage protein
MADYGSVRGKGGNSGGGRRRKKVQGETALRGVLRGLPDQLSDAIKREIREAAELVHYEALKRIPNEHQNPYSTGELSSKFKVVIDRGGLRARVGSFGRNRARHSHFVEFGTAAGTRKDRYGNSYQHPGTPAKPFLLPAYQLTRVANYARIKAAVVAALDAASRGNGVLAGTTPVAPQAADLASLIGDSL